MIYWQMAKLESLCQIFVLPFHSRIEEKSGIGPKTLKVVVSSVNSRSIDISQKNMTRD